VMEMDEADHDGAFVNQDSHEFLPTAIFPKHARSISLAPSEPQIKDQTTFIQRGTQERSKNDCMEQRNQTIEVARLPELDFAQPVCAAHISDQTRHPALTLFFWRRNSAR